MRASDLKTEATPSIIPLVVKTTKHLN